MKKIKQFMLAFCSFTLVFSTLANVVINVSATENNNNLAVNSVKEAINKLVDAKNYTIEVTTKIGKRDYTYNIYYTENAFYDDFIGDEYGYVSVDDGVFSFDLYNREFTASKLLYSEEGTKLTSIWNNDLIPSFEKVKSNQFKDATGKSYQTSKKVDQLLLLSILKLEITNHDSENVVKFSVDDSINGFKMDYDLKNGKNYSCVVKDFGTTKIDIVDEYLKENSYHQSSTTLNRIMELFAGYNYTRVMYSDDERLDSPVIAHEYFNENYFCVDYSKEAVALELVVPGLNVVSINNMTFEDSEVINGVTYGPYTFNGCYYMQLDEDLENITNMVLSFPINSNPNISEVFNYPTLLKMFANPQYLVEAGSENQFYTHNVALVNDFVSNFQQADTLSSLGATPVGVYVEYLPEGNEEKYPETGNKETVVFGLEVSYYGQLQVIDYVLTDFGTTVIDCITTENIRKYIQDTIDRVKEEARKEESGTTDDTASTSN